MAHLYVSFMLQPPAAVCMWEEPTSFKLEKVPSGCFCVLRVVISVYSIRICLFLVEKRTVLSLCG